MKRTILIVFGTRPEAIKMAPLVLEFLKYSDEFDVKVCVTAQHRHMLDQILSFFEIIPDFDLDIMKLDQGLSELSANIIVAMRPVLQKIKPDCVFVHGDTTTSTMVALAAFYEKIKVCHVEAGLRTLNKYSPYPEEINRQLTARLADIHFSPTWLAKQHLQKEGIDEKQIYVTGNTVIDALLLTKEKLLSYHDKEIEYLSSIVNAQKKLIVVTGHRRENFGNGFFNICEAIKELSQQADVQIIYPVHLNPNVQIPVYEKLGGLDNVYLINPLSYPAFTWLISKAFFILTDSGGVQEEAPSLGKPVLVMRDTTERPEAVDAGTVKLVGADKGKIVQEGVNLLNNSIEYQRMSSSHNPYGDGSTSAKIVTIIKNIL
jgi:UDP-N-acetylglucosamine 2-epimerase (non-hydrolysing)